jgi:molecular chaperone GrpE
MQEVREALSSEERYSREGESPREEPIEEQRETDDVSGPVEVGGSEDPGVVPEPPREEDLEEAPEEKLAEEAPPEEVLSEEALEITPEEVSMLADELEAARRERDEYLDDMRRMKAEMENSRKRLERERTRYVQAASERLAGELLPVLDNLERALEAQGDVREGVRATRDQLVAVLAREGLVQIHSDGESFDPAVHEAVMSMPSDEHEEDTVVQTLEPGYMLNDRTIRPAKVIVSKQV